MLVKAAHYLNTHRHRLIDVLPINSPRCAVSRSVRVTVQYFETGVLPKEVIRTTHAALAHYEHTGKIRGPKTGAFARALKGDDEAIVLDTWMADALAVDQYIFSTKWGRSISERRIRYCAHVMGVTPRQFQAACWSGQIMRGKGNTVPSIHRAFEEILS